MHEPQANESGGLSGTGRENRFLIQMISNCGAQYWIESKLLVKSEKQMLY